MRGRPPPVAMGKVRVDVAPVQAVEVCVPVQIISEANQRGHWAKHARRRQVHRETGALAVRLCMVWMVRLKLWERPVLVTLTRLRGRRGRALDDDNLGSGFKSFRDGVAMALGVDDGDKNKAQWKYGEEKGSGWGVRVRIEALEAIGAKERA
jgi:hypothetical protein